MSLDARIASLIAFSQSRAMGTGTNAGGGALAGASDCGRDEDGKFGGGNKCASAGSSFQPKSLEQQRLEAAGTFAATKEKTQADKVGEMKDYLRRLGHGWADFARKAQAHDPAGIKNANHAKNNAARIFAEEGAAGFDRYLEQIGMRSIHSRAFCPTGDGGGVDNSCGSVGGPAIKSKSGGSMPKSKVEDPRNANSWLSPSGEFHPVARERDDGGWNTHHRWAISHGVTGGEEELLSAGWMRVVRLGQSLYAANENGKALTDKQSKSLLAHAAWAGYDDVVHEHAKGRSKTVWSKDDRSVTFDARYASLLAFAQSRDCGRDEDGKFSSGNTCAGGAAAEAAKGAVAGGIKGAITGLLTGGPVVVKPAAAIGAATGAVKGLYDNQMRPTRVKRTIEKLGMTDAKVGNLVEKLGGSPRSTADVKGNSLRLTIRDKEGKKTFHVEVDKKTITVYPRREIGELNAREIERVKKIADEATPKSVSVVVKSSSSSYVAKLVKSGFTMAAGHARDILLATYSTPLVHSVVVDAAQSVKKRVSSRGFCPTGEGGGIDNSCSSQDGGFAAASAGATKTYSKAAEIEGPTKFDSQEIAKEIACDRFDEDKKLEHWADGSRSMQADVSAHVAAVRLASMAVPEIGEARINFISRRDAANAGMFGGLSPDQARGILGLTSMYTGEIRMIVDNPPTPEGMQKSFKSGVLSTDHPSHALVHEFAHHLQVEGLKAFLLEDVAAAMGSASSRDKKVMQEFLDHLEGGGPIPQGAVDDYGASVWKKFSELALREEDVRPWAINALKGSSLKDNPAVKKRLAELESGHHLSDVEFQAYHSAFQEMAEGRRPTQDLPHPEKGTFASKVLQVSRYAATHPLELTAEYWTAVSLGYMRRDKDMDEMCIAAHMPLPKEKRGRAKK